VIQFGPNFLYDNSCPKQLLVVEQALENATDEPQRQELLALKTNLQELLALTRETQDDPPPSNEVPQQADHLDNELERLRSELNDLEGAVSHSPSHRSATFRAPHVALFQPRCALFAAQDFKER